MSNDEPRGERADAAAVASGEKMSLHEQTAGADYAMQMLHVVARVATAGDAAAAAELLKLATSRLGADVAMFTSFVRDDSSLSSFRYLVACDPVWALEY